MLRILALEPYFGGSHQAFLEGYREYSRHEVTLLTLPARKWKWRMRGAALTFAGQLAGCADQFDALLASDFLDLAAFVALAQTLPDEIARVVYFHENQLTYPVRREDERDYQFGFTNITTCLAADRVLFNSRYHMESFLTAAAVLLRMMPDGVPHWVPERIRGRSAVVPVGVDFRGIDAVRAAAPPRSGPLTVLWNHRWEHDKGAETFFEVMMELDEEGLPFELAVCGETFREAPAVFELAREKLAPRLVTFGYVRSRDDYCHLLADSDVVVSTAAHEFFGVAVVEAIRAGCMPLLPAELSYPEILPPSAHGTCLYRGRGELKERLARYMRAPEEARGLCIADEMERYGWPAVAPRLDAVFEGLCGG